ncbi:MAG: ATP-binding protein [bacterium]
MSKKNIILMDNDPDTRKEIELLLLKKGYIVHIAHSIKIAFSVIKEFDIDLIIYDLSLIKFLERFNQYKILKKNPVISQIPFLIVISHIELVEYLTNLDVEPEDFTTKPIDEILLLTRIKSIFSKQDKNNHTYKIKLDNLKENISLALPHEIRTSLTGIIGFSNLIIEMMRGKKNLCESEIIEIIEMSESIYESGRRLSHLTENFIMYSQIQVIKLYPNKMYELRQQITLNPEEIIAEITNDLGIYNQRQNDFYLNIQNESLAISNEYFQKIIWEIIDNAIKFSKPGSNISIKTRSKTKYYCIIIKDNGIGMTNEQIQSIDAYEQYNRDIQEQQGTGLGLMISKLLTQLHKGKFEIYSEENKGTKIIIKLPKIIE